MKALATTIFNFVVLFSAVNLTQAQTNIYNSNGTLTSNRTISLSGRSLTFSANSSNYLFMNGSNGNIGVGTTFPTEKIDIIGNVQAQKGIFNKSLPDGTNFSSSADRNAKCLVLTAGTLKDLNDMTRTFNFLDFPASNINPYPQIVLGISDRANKGRLRFVADQGRGSDFLLYDKDQETNFKVFDDGNNQITVHMPKPRSRMVIAGGESYLPEHKFVVRGSSKIEGNILTDSNVGIGTASFTDGSDNYRLSVNGNVRAHRVRVYTDWADYVFDDDYKLLPLEELKSFIDKNKHLPNIPSANEVEQQGIELGEMNKMLLEKIEELTLYMINLNKEIETLKKQLNNKSNEK